MARGPSKPGFWGWLEHRLKRLQRDPERSRRVLEVVWWVSVAFVAFGLAVIVYVLLLGGSWPPRL